MKTIIVTLQLKVAPERRLHILKTIHTMIGPTQAQPDCLYCEMFGSTQDDDTLLLLEKWASQTSMEQHVQSDEFRKVMAVMDAACQPPEISFYETDSPQGMELVEKIIEKSTM
jgi:quinol monooxygenase YgiN